MANDKERKTYVCSLCHKSMNRKLSFERHKRNCAEKTQGDLNFRAIKASDSNQKVFLDFLNLFKLLIFKDFISTSYHNSLGAKSRNFHPYQCPSPKMAQKSAGAFMESFQNRISDMYRLKS